MARESSALAGVVEEAAMRRHGVGARARFEQLRLIPVKSLYNGKCDVIAGQREVSRNL